MPFHVRPLTKARQDVAGILNWLIDEMRTPQGAAAWFEAYENAARGLATNAEIHGLAPEDGHVDYTLQQALFKTRRGRTYRIIYTIDGDEVLLLRVRGPGQAPVHPSDLR